MLFVSTRGSAPAVQFSRATLDGLAPDGGLYVPEKFPSYDMEALDGTERYDDFAAEVLQPFVVNDPLGSQLGSVCRSAFDFPAPLIDVGRATAMLELFHGPSAAFKDFGARFLASCLERFGVGPLAVLVATSGDTGTAVASACHRRSAIEVGILFPEGGVSRRQERLLTCWDANVRSFAVRGSFDDCQRIVKEIFVGEDPWPGGGRLTSANSINIGRLLPQVVYYAFASLAYLRERGRRPGFVVPSGNLGNAVAAFWAQRMGFPIREIAIATNANRVVPDWFDTGEWTPRPPIRTLANAMDVGNPSNMERLFHLYEGGSRPEREVSVPKAAGDLRSVAIAMSVTDEEIRQTIAEGVGRWGRVFCPHTATAIQVRERLDSPDWIVVATAHPAKFDEVVEPLIGRSVELPSGLAQLLARPRNVIVIDANADAVRKAWVG